MCAGGRLKGPVSQGIIVHLSILTEATTKIQSWPETVIVLRRDQESLVKGKEEKTDSGRGMEGGRQGRPLLVYELVGKRRKKGKVAEGSVKCGLQARLVLENERQVGDRIDSLDAG